MNILSWKDKVFTAFKKDSLSLPIPMIIASTAGVCYLPLSLTQQHEKRR